MKTRVGLICVLSTLVLGASAAFAAPSFAGFAPVGGKGKGTSKSLLYKLITPNTIKCVKDSSEWKIPNLKTIEVVAKGEECKEGTRNVTRFRISYALEWPSFRVTISGSVTFPLFGGKEPECEIEMTSKENEELSGDSAANAKEGKILDIESDLTGLRYKTNGHCGELTTDEKSATLGFEGPEELEGAEVNEKE